MIQPAQSYALVAPLYGAGEFMRNAQPRRKIPLRSQVSVFVWSVMLHQNTLNHNRDQREGFLKQWFRTGKEHPVSSIIQLIIVSPKPMNILNVILCLQRHNVISVESKQCSFILLPLPWTFPTFFFLLFFFFRSQQILSSLPLKETAHRQWSCAFRHQNALSKNF